jgi:hypothetical protein
MDAKLIAARRAYLANADGAVVWGISDCATSAAAAIQAATGQDLWALYRGQYQDRATLRRLTGCGVSRLLKRFASSHGWEACDGTKGLCIGIVIGSEGPGIAMGFDGTWLARGGLAVMVEPVNRVHSAWRVC